MSDYYGAATLEDWLAEEVFSVENVPVEVVKLFEQWRDGVERDIESWMESDDGNGYNLSWRGWGRGFASIEDLDDFESAISKGMSIIERLNDNQ